MSVCMSVCIGNRTNLSTIVKIVLVTVGVLPGGEAEYNFRLVR